MLTLYDCKTTGGACVQATLAEAGAAFEVREIDYANGGTKTTEFLSINPRGQIPTLITPGGHVLTESAAILMSLADNYPQKELIPPPGHPERGQMTRWMVFMATNIYEGYLRCYYPQAFTNKEIEPVMEKGRNHVDAQWAILEQEASASPYFLKDHGFSVLDIYIWMLFQWEGDTTRLGGLTPKIRSIAESVMERPAISPIQDWHFGPGLGYEDV
ncbi:glutathione S-transferase family protein (plasmid) [Pseudohalocynthiibacter aestuariivivens]|nr:glutathione S-transferase family protein [Pseudohalocynthiibacter aestuariivivens]QIE48194.1 glutathione S-transferase family protein [Pseudohalocynthiibacter aestuariivivens]